MSDPQQPPRVSNKVSPLAVIVVIILVGIVIVALVNRRGHHTSANGMQAPMAASNGVMPQQPDLPNGPAPRANTNDAVEAIPTGNQEGIPGAGGPGNSTR
jgi:hypothetical protein